MSDVDALLNYCVLKLYLVLSITPSKTVWNPVINDILKKHFSFSISLNTICINSDAVHTVYFCLCFYLFLFISLFIFLVLYLLLVFWFIGWKWSNKNKYQHLLSKGNCWELVCWHWLSEDISMWFKCGKEGINSCSVNQLVDRIFLIIDSFITLIL